MSSQPSNWDKDKTVIRLLRNKAVKCESIELHFPSLEEIFENLDQYLQFVQVLSFDPEAFLKQDIEKFQEFSDFEIFYYFVTQPGEFQNVFFEAMAFFTKQTFVLYEEVIASFHQKEDKSWEVKQLLTEELWETIRQIMYIAHKMTYEARRKPESDKGKEIERKLRETKEKIQKIKDNQAQGEKISLQELVSAVAACSNSYNLFNIWGLNYYQFFDQYERMRLFDDYHFALDQILAGVDPKKLEITHWASSIQQD